MSEYYMPEDVDPDDLGGFIRLAPGTYHVSVLGIDEDEGKGKLIVQFEVLEGTNKDMIGNTHKEWITTNTKPGNVKKVISLALALGLTTLDALRTAKANDEYFAIDWAAGQGRTCVIEIEEDEGQDGKLRSKIPYWNIYHVDSKEAKGVPLRKEAIGGWDTGDDPFAGASKEPNLADDADPFA